MKQRIKDVTNVENVELKRTLPKWKQWIMDKIIREETNKMYHVKLWAWLDSKQSVNISPNDVIMDDSGNKFMVMGKTANSMLRLETIAPIEHPLARNYKINNVVLMSSTAKEGRN